MSTINVGDRVRLRQGVEVYVPTGWERWPAGVYVLVGWHTDAFTGRVNAVVGPRDLHEFVSLTIPARLIEPLDRERRDTGAPATGILA